MKKLQKTLCCLNSAVYSLLMLWLISACGGIDYENQITEHVIYYGEGPYFNTIRFEFPDGYYSIWGPDITSYYYDDNYLMAVLMPPSMNFLCDSCHYVADDGPNNHYLFEKTTFRLYDINNKKDYGDLKLTEFLVKCDSLKIEYPLRKIGKYY